jgi:hypothetical protein
LKVIQTVPRTGRGEWNDLRELKHDKTKQNKTTLQNGSLKKNSFVIVQTFLDACPKPLKTQFNFTLPNHLCDFPFVQLLINLLQVLIINLIHTMPMSFVYLFSTIGNDTHFLLLPILAINVR